MTQAQDGRSTYILEGSRPDELIERALRHLVVRQKRREEAAFTLVFSGEGPTLEAALLAALDDIRDQAADHRGTPVEIATSGVFVNEAGARIWGTVECLPGGEAPAISDTTIISIHQESDNKWTITIAPA